MRMIWEFILWVIALSFLTVTSLTLAVGLLAGVIWVLRVVGSII